MPIASAIDNSNGYENDVILDPKSNDFSASPIFKEKLLAFLFQPTIAIRICLSEKDDFFNEINLR